jgi:hypothetical protein
MDTEVAYDTELSTLAPANPTKAQDDQNTYQFDGWIVNDGDTPVPTQNLPKIS